MAKGNVCADIFEIANKVTLQSLLEVGNSIDARMVHAVILFLS